MKSLARDLPTSAPDSDRKPLSGPPHSNPGRKSWRRTFEFLGQRQIALLSVSILVGLLLFCVEILFAFGTQALLMLLGGVAPDGNHFFDFLGPVTTKLVFAVLFVSGLLRAFLSSANVWLQLVSPAEFVSLQRSRILDWVFRSKSVSSQRTLDLFHEMAMLSGNTVRNLQITLTRGTITLLLGASLFVLSPAISFVTCCLLTVLAPSARRLNSRIRRSSEGLLREWKHVSSRVTLGIRNLLLLRIYGTQEKELGAARGNLKSHFVHYTNQASAVGLFQALPQLGGVMLLIFITFAANTRYGMGRETSIAYLYLVMRFLQSATGTIEGISGLLLYRPQIRELYQWWEERRQEVQVPDSSASPTAKIARGRIGSPIGWRFSGVDFSYEGVTSPTLSKIDLEIKPGATLVVLGPSGTGKSTFLALMLGQLVPQNGRIEVLIDGKSLPVGLVEDDLLPAIGYVGPEPFMNEGTIYENLVYSLTHQPSEAELTAAIEKAQCQFIYKLSKGLQHPITDQGQGLSAGQKQRLSLARALLRNPKALILDEATSNLDDDTEQKLVDALAKLKGEMTIVAVTHRRELLRISDQQLRLRTEEK